MKWQKGDLIQIDPEHDTVFGGCIMTVTEEKEWGAQGYVKIPGQGLAYYRLKNADGVKVGAAEWLFETSLDEEDEA